MTASKQRSKTAHRTRCQKSNRFVPRAQRICMHNLAQHANGRSVLAPTRHQHRLCVLLCTESLCLTRFTLMVGVQKNFFFLGRHFRVFGHSAPRHGEVRQGRVPRFQGHMLVSLRVSAVRTTAVVPRTQHKRPRGHALAPCRCPALARHRTAIFSRKNPA